MMKDESGHYAFAELLCRVLGLENQRVRSFTLRVAVDEVVTVKVEREVVRPSDALIEELETEVGHFRLERIPTENPPELRNMCKEEV